MFGMHLFYMMLITGGFGYRYGSTQMLVSIKKHLTSRSIGIVGDIDYRGGCNLPGVVTSDVARRGTGNS